MRYLLLAACCLAPGCAESGSKSELQQESVSLGDSFDEALLVLGSSRLLAECYVNMVTVSGEAARLTEQTAVREGSIRWRIMTAGRLDRIRAVNDPRMRFAALWTLAVQMRIGFVAGEDRSRFGDQQQRYQEFARAFEQNVTGLGYRAFPDSVIEQVKPEIENLARTVGVTGWFTPEAGRVSQGALSQLMSVPLSPISGLQGVGNTPAAINRFTETARDMTTVVENIPERTRWQIELMLLEAESQGAVAAALRELSETRKAIEQATTQFPEQTRQLLADPNLSANLERIQRVIESAGGLSREFTQLLAEFRRAAADVQRTLAEAQEASVGVERSAIEVRKTTEFIRRDEERASTRPGKSEEDKFRVRDVEKAAARVEAAAAEVRNVISDMRAEGAVPALSLGAQQAERFVRTVTWSVALLIGIAFVAGLGLIVVWRLLNPRPKAPQGPA